MTRMPSATLPALPWHGSCQCGAISYVLHEYPQTFYCCHCTECQKQASSMHGESVIVRRDAIEITGETKTWTRPTDSGNTTICHFCPECGTRIFHQGTHRTGPEATISLKGGTLEPIGLLEPVGHIWLKSAQKGFRADPAALKYDRQPETYDELCEAFVARNPAAV